MKPVETARRLRDRNVQRALLQFFKPENDATVRAALLRAGRGDLIGDGPDCLIPAKPPRLPSRRGDSGPRGPRGRPRQAGYRRAARERGEGRGDSR